MTYILFSSSIILKFGNFSHKGASEDSMDLESLTLCQSLKIYFTYITNGLRPFIKILKRTYQHYRQHTRKINSFTWAVFEVFTKLIQFKDNSITNQLRFEVMKIRDVPMYQYQWYQHILRV